MRAQVDRAIELGATPLANEQLKDPIALTVAHVLEARFLPSVLFERVNILSE
jgi:hypothetical protein